MVAVAAGYRVVFIRTCNWSPLRAAPNEKPTPGFDTATPFQGNFKSGSVTRTSCDPSGRVRAICI